MPLPAALLARLAQRGIVSKEKLREEKEKNEKEEDEEEIFAEDYDDGHNLIYNKNDTYSPTPSDGENEDNIEDQINLKFKGHLGCPNKSNVYHECSKFCKTKWGSGIRIPNKIYIKKKNKMLLKYPLPEHWKEIYDPGYGRFYYWDMDTDNVSWLPPNHPKAVISECAATLKEERNLVEGDKDDSSTSDSEDDEDNYDEEDDEDVEQNAKQKAKENAKLMKQKQKEKEMEDRKRRQLQKEEKDKIRAKGRAKKRENDLDPMDPASYSDIPRGGWSDGLQAEAKTGVDSTVSGTLYQQRPYPSPGDILRANKKKKVQNDDDDDDSP